MREGAKAVEGEEEEGPCLARSTGKGKEARPDGGPGGLRGDAAGTREAAAGYYEGGGGSVEKTPPPDQKGKSGWGPPGWGEKASMMCPRMGLWDILLWGTGWVGLVNGEARRIVLYLWTHIGTMAFVEWGSLWQAWGREGSPVRRTYVARKYPAFCHMDARAPPCVPLAWGRTPSQTATWVV